MKKHYRKVTIAQILLKDNDDIDTLRSTNSYHK